MEKQYKAVFFDLGGTLRIAFLEEAYMRHARRKMAEIAGTDMPYEEFYQMIEERYEPYRKWALGEFKESGDEELWCKWLLPDYDPARIRQVCHELSFQYRQCKGRREVVDGGVEVIKGLHERGYKLGIISNLIGENEVPDWLEEDRLALLPPYPQTGRCSLDPLPTRLMHRMQTFSIFCLYSMVDYFSLSRGGTAKDTPLFLPF